MRQAEPLKEIQGLERTVQAIMKQIYDCTLFLRSYGESGFVGKYLVAKSNRDVVHLCLIVRTLQNSFTVKTDNAIQQFVDAFNNLKRCFHDRLNLDSWKIARTLKGGVLQLVAITDRLKVIGKLNMSIMLLFQFSILEAQPKMSS